MSMARVPYPTREEYPEAYRGVYDRMINERGPSHIFLALANIPNLLDLILSFTKEMKHRSVIEQRLRELSIVTVGLMAQSDYEFDHHWNIALKAGVRRVQLEQLADAETSPEFDEAERAVVRYAREATLHVDVSDETWNALTEHLPLRETMDIVMAVAWYNGVVRMLKPMRIETESWFKRA
jgi:alkylhydroperoxidase family enzyme